MPRVLIIEDDDATADEIGRELQGHGFETQRARSGADGMGLALAGPFEAITLDRMLPDMDGLEIARALAARGVETPILMISALDDVDERVRGLRAGGDDYLAKPFALAEMAARLEVLIRRRGDRGGLVLRYADLELDLLAHRARRGLQAGVGVRCAALSRGGRRRFASRCCTASPTPSAWPCSWASSTWRSPAP
jgi:two-component system OmpR family response regulator